MLTVGGKYFYSSNWQRFLSVLPKHLALALWRQRVTWRQKKNCFERQKESGERIHDGEVGEILGKSQVSSVVLFLSSSPSPSFPGRAGVINLLPFLKKKIPFPPVPCVRSIRAISLRFFFFRRGSVFHYISFFPTIVGWHTIGRQFWTTAVCVSMLCLNPPTVFVNTKGKNFSWRISGSIGGGKKRKRQVWSIFRCQQLRDYTTEEERRGKRRRGLTNAKKRKKRKGWFAARVLVSCE